MPLKITTWNIENSHRLISGQDTANESQRKSRIKETIEIINPDILCIQEGPMGEQGITEFCDQVFDLNWVPVLLRGEDDDLGDRDRDYKTRGTQWIWFLVRPELKDNCRLQLPSVWQSFTDAKSWKVNFWGKKRARRHSHYRHPQVMICDLENGDKLELIGVHLKSKHNTRRIERDRRGNITSSHVDEALKATEARNVREYIDAKFSQVVNPSIVLLGDCNDGPGHDFFEQQYLFFDLVSNLQGDVIISERFFSHALFSVPQHLRWTARFSDPVLEISATNNPLLLDHILVSQPLINGDSPFILASGQIEHEAFEIANSGANRNTRSSDHRPVSCRFDENEPLDV